MHASERVLAFVADVELQLDQDRPTLRLLIVS